MGLRPRVKNFAKHNIHIGIHNSYYCTVDDGDDAQIIRKLCVTRGKATEQ